jgi:hypothetical protein
LYVRVRVGEFNNGSNINIIGKEFINNIIDFNGERREIINMKFIKYDI